MKTFSSERDVDLTSLLWIQFNKGVIRLIQTCCFVLFIKRTNLKESFIWKSCYRCTICGLFTKKKKKSMLYLFGFTIEHRRVMCS